MSCGFPSLMLSESLLLSVMDRKKGSSNRVLATSPEQKVYGLSYFLKSALAGGVCCGITHGAMCPVDVVKTRIQLDPTKFKGGIIGGFKQIVKAEGMKGLTTGLGPTVLGYFVQGNFYIL